MKMQITKIVVALAAAGFLATAIAANDQFNKLDADADGMISAEEAAVQEGLSAADANADGMIDAAEFSAFEMMGEEKKAPEGK